MPPKNRVLYIFTNLTKACKYPQYIIKNSIDFKEKVQNISIPKNSIMASLDIVALYPSVPYELVKEIIKKRWKDIHKHTKMNLTEFLKGLEVLMNSLYFQFNELFYQQIDGMPIGLSVSPILADIVLQDLESDYLLRYKKSISFYVRYVDDTFLVISKNKLKMLVNLLNKYHIRLKFTHEVEINNELSFLDILVKKQTNGTVKLDL